MWTFCSNWPPNPHRENVFSWNQKKAVVTVCSTPCWRVGINVQLKPIGHFKWSQQCVLSWRNPLHLLSNEFGKQYNRSPQTIITEIYCESFVELLWIIWLSRLGASREGSELKIPHYSTRIVLNICYHHLAGTFKWPIVMIVFQWASVRLCNVAQSPMCSQWYR